MLHPDGRSMSPPQTSDISSGGGSPPLSGQQALNGSQQGAASGGLDDDVIPTAIVIKNIPFNVKRETLLDIIVRRLRSALLCCSVASTVAATPSRGHVEVNLLTLFYRHHSPSQHHTPSIITSIQQANSVVWLLPTSAWLRMQTLLWLP